MSALAVAAALAAQAAATTDTSVLAPTNPISGASRPGSTTYVNLEAGAGYSTNPSLSIDDDRGAAFGRFSVNAVHARISERTSTALSAYAQTFFYTRRSSQQSFDLSGRHSAQVNERLSIYGNADLSYDRGGQLDTRIIDLPNVPLPPGAVQPPVLLPPGTDFLSVSGRTYRASANVGGSLALGARDSVSGTAGIQHVVSKSGLLDTRYTTVPVSIGYNRQLSTRTAVGVRLAAQRTDYNGPETLRSISPQLTLQTTLSERMTFSGAVGVSFSKSDNGIESRSSTGLQADASLCRLGELSRFCGRAAVSQQVATAAGAAKSVSLGVDYSRRLDANQTLALSLNADRYSTPILQVTNLSFSRATYVRGAAEYARKFSGRWFGGVNLAARKLAESGPDPKADVSGTVFVRFRLGDAQ
jgi:hypothetical protein